MAKEQGILNDVPELYKRNALNLLMFGYVKGAKKVEPALSVSYCVGLFMKEFNLSNTEFNPESAATIFGRMSKEANKL